ncbi:MAG: endonuclease/exonuclease/phosphatase family protein, partial [Rhabdochlamydiaceae bacterium]
MFVSLYNCDKNISTSWCDIVSEVMMDDIVGLCETGDWNRPPNDEPTADRFRFPNFEVISSSKRLKPNLNTLNRSKGVKLLINKGLSAFITSKSTIHRGRAVAAEMIFNTGFQLAVACVYQYTMSHRKRSFRVSLEKYKTLQRKVLDWTDTAKSRGFAVIVLGDMNAVIDQSQRTGPPSKADSIFQQIRESILQDTFSAVHGMAFSPTWTTKSSLNIAARLDYILSDRGLTRAVTEVSHTSIEQSTSDHKLVRAKFQFIQAHWSHEVGRKIDWRLESDEAKEKFIQALEEAMTKHKPEEISEWMAVTTEVIRKKLAHDIRPHRFVKTSDRYKSLSYQAYITGKAVEELNTYRETRRLTSYTTRAVKMARTKYPLNAETR